MRKDWTPSTVTYIARSSYPALFFNDLALFLCHTGRPVDQRGDVDYVPTIFVFTKAFKRRVRDTTGRSDWRTENSS